MAQFGLAIGTNNLHVLNEWQELGSLLLVSKLVNAQVEHGLSQAEGVLQKC